jgi:hypothetical protein
MKKTVLSLATIAAASFLSMAADCSGSNIVACTTDEDCTTDGDVCGIAEGGTEGTCVTPSCETGTDCDLMDTGTGSPIYSVDDLDAGNDSCEDEGTVTILGFDGAEYCAVEDTVDAPCDATATADLKAGGTAEVCVIADGTCDPETRTCG